MSVRRVEKQCTGSSYPSKERQDETKRRKENKANLGKLVTGVLAGGVIGAALGWLTAPAAGAETRRQLQSRVMKP